MRKNIISIFKEQVIHNQNKCALISEKQGSMTYKELDMISDYYACEIKERVNTNEKYIGICLQRSFEMIAAIIGILKAGKAYVPLAPSYPTERIKFYCQTAHIKTVLCNEKTATQFFENPIDVDKINLNGRCSDDGFEFCRKMEDAYLLFTSGSTGVPKGVMVSQESILNTLLWRIEYYGLSNMDIVLQVPSISFSSSVEDIFSTLLSGGELVLLEESDLYNMKKLSYLLAKYQVTHFLMVPSLYNYLVNYIEENKLKFVVLAGEPITRDLIIKHNTKLRQVDLFVEYGMTETSVGCTAGKLTTEKEDNYIGFIIDNMYGKIIEMDENGIGELVIYGVGVAKGYINAADEKNQFIEYEGEKAFKTGDYVRRASDGGYIYVCRKDKQIKINGQRINLSEINNILYTIKEIEYVVTLPVEVDSKVHLVSFLESTKGDIVDIARISIERSLPKQYWPRSIIHMKEMPRLPNGKIDTYSLKEYYIAQY